MCSWFQRALVSAAMLIAVGVLAALPASADAGSTVSTPPARLITFPVTSTAICRDYTAAAAPDAASACSGHGGILDWFGVPTVSATGLQDNAASAVSALLPPGAPIAEQAPATGPAPASKVAPSLSIPTPSVPVSPPTNPPAPPTATPTVHTPPPGCVSYTGGSCVTLCNDGQWSSSTASGTCSDHGGEAP